MGHYTAYIAWLPKQGVGAFAMSNGGAGDGPKNVVNSILQSYIP